MRLKLRDGPLLRVVVLACLALTLAPKFADFSRFPFFNEDYLFLDRTRVASFASLWGGHDLAFGYYRPFARELYFWAVQHLLGPNAAGFHWVNGALWLAILGCFLALVTDLAGIGVGILAAAGAATMVAWATPLVWASAAQELWMLLFALLSLLAFARGRGWFACIALALALLSKETAAVLPVVAAAHQWLIARRKPAEIFKRTAPLGGVVAIWAVAHPTLAQLLRGGGAPVGPHATATHVLSTAVRTILVPINLDLRPSPEAGWGAAAAASLPAALALGIVALMAWLSERRGKRPESAANGSRDTGTARLVAFGGIWAIAGFGPALAPGLTWHAYYALLGSLGVWIALGAATMRAPAAAIGLMFGLVWLHAARADTLALGPESDLFRLRTWAMERSLHANLLEQHPNFPPHSRVFFALLPGSSGLMIADGRVLHYWYRDPTLRGGYFSSFRRRSGADTLGRDYFFRFDNRGGRFVETFAGPEDVAAARATNARWNSDHEMLAITFERAHDWPAALEEYQKLAAAEPESARYLRIVEVCRTALRDSTATGRSETGRSGF